MSWFNRLFVQTTWGMGVAPGSIDRLLRTGVIPGATFTAGSSENYRYLADPFPVSTGSDGSLSVLCEEFDLWGENRGIIRFVQIKDGKVISNLPALSLPGHSSFPFLFRHDGDLFCVPETGQAGEIAIHRAMKLPDLWQLHAVIVKDFPAADPTVFQFEGRWWLAATSIQRAQYDSLYLWQSDTLKGPWHPHPGNPVKIDLRSARPAGTPFVYQGVLYRPAQDCAGGYGRRVTINRVDVLSSEQFIETPVATIEPDPNGPFPHGLHTVNFIDGLIVIDGRRDFFDLFKQVKKQIVARMIRRWRHGKKSRGAATVVAPRVAEEA